MPLKAGNVSLLTQSKTQSDRDVKGLAVTFETGWKGGNAAGAYKFPRSLSAWRMRFTASWYAAFLSLQ